MRRQQYLDFGRFLNAVITFVLTAAGPVLRLRRPHEQLRERRAKGEEAAEETELDLLRQIRDGLNRPGGTPRAPDPRVGASRRGAGGAPAGTARGRRGRPLGLVTPPWGPSSDVSSGRTGSSSDVVVDRTSSSSGSDEVTEGVPDRPVERGVRPDHGA